MINNFFKRFCTSIILAPVVMLCIYNGDNFFLGLLITVLFVGIYEIYNLKILYTKLLLFFLLFFFLFLIFKIRVSENGMLYVFYIIILTWLSDIGGYVFGKLIGGKKIKFISPNKTFSGFLGSILFSQFSIIFIINFNLFIEYDLLFKIVITTSLCLLIIIGDLFFSYIKRINKIKDYSNIFPGHGGMFDRIDGLIFAVIFINIYL